MNYKENYYESLRRELVAVVEQKMSPVALKYGYSQTGLEEKIKWRPVVLLLGNYSSGKSTLINELLGQPVQKTGQAPTDDSFTVITYNEDDEREDRDGMVLLNDPEFPFSSLKKQGKRFASHFKLKKVKSPFLESLALIDTPGMLDSVSERDRGYDYQEVIGEFANIADLILILFDPHKAGTIRETYESLRKTIPKSTYEDRVLFVLNRVDECENLNDLLRVYGTLCWNLSQMTGRKDIPHIHFTYSSENANPPEFLGLLQNQRAELKQNILKAPKHRLDHLATYIEDHSEKLSHFLEAIIQYGRKKRLLMLQLTLLGLLVSGLFGGLVFWLLSSSDLSASLSREAIPFLGSGAALVSLIAWVVVVEMFFVKRFYRATLADPEDLTPLYDQHRRDNWERVEDRVKAYLEKSRGKVSLFALQRDFRSIRRSAKKAAKDVRAALTEYNGLKANGETLVLSSSDET
ncbi:dynamin family protein [Pseudobacteriovorax antillogorgiicola]|uniref:Dynamin family protein n=1 Tax=Pseudobacteriovorax antillogorgiicola TaxID=1513793 RepID=A0A1Y6BWE6_9BACT|nr:dynamin family protein [Pseudobacteriovorax antillogorgiicola]TCS53828.1 dynamin family protein [Pseudobacteriovorax antillogorgiicola]SMF21797.1 Dynamin family protein [Pseudobacteriovorax antillogorgiicola]